MQHLLLLTPARSYRTADFLAAARRLGVRVTVGCDEASALADARAAVVVPFAPLGEGVARILELAREAPIDAVVATDDGCTLLAAAAARALGLRHNHPDAAAVVADKHWFRCALASAGLRTPRFALLRLDDDRAAAASSTPYPCVIKPLHLSGSRGVIRADDEASFTAAAARIDAMLAADPRTGCERHARHLLVEDFIPGREVCLDALLEDGRVLPLAILDKPCTSDGPFFEETVLVAPTTLTRGEVDELVADVARIASAIGLRHGPVHAEARIDGRGVWLLELAARPLGGLCSRALAFTPDLTLEELVVRHALSMPVHNHTLSATSSGVMMIPIPAAGRLLGVHGVGAARAVPGVEDVAIRIGAGEQLVPLPEGDRYLGFIFARGESRARTEASLHAAHALLRFDVDTGSRARAGLGPST